MRIQLSLNMIWFCSMLFLIASGCDGDEDSQAAQSTTTEFEPSEAKRTASPAPPTAPSPGKSARPTQPGKTRLIVLEDRRCKERECLTAPTIQKLEATLPGIEVELHDWSEDECKALFDAEGLKHLPAFLFHPGINTNPGYQRIARYMAKTPKGELKLLKTGARFDPRAEICDNGIDDTGNGLVDCQDASCQKKPICREEIPKRLDLFTMSMCPFGTMAIDSMSEILDAFDRKIDFHIHYIASETDKGFRALHGPPEVDENIRELCAIEHFPKGYRYMEYIWCRNRKIKDKDWKQCTGKKGIKAGPLEKCFTGEEGKKLLREDLKLAQQLGVTASPTWLANNRFLFHGIAPEKVKQQFCAHNKGLQGCEKKLSSKTPKPAGVCK